MNVEQTATEELLAEELFRTLEELAAVRGALREAEKELAELMARFVGEDV